MTRAVGAAVPRVLNLGAGVQSTTLLLLAAQGRIPRFDVAIFADTGWEPPAVYEHLARIEREVAAPAGIAILRVSAGNIRADALDPGKRYASMPLHLRNLNGDRAMGRRQCTAQYKIRPIQEAMRRLLGATDKANGTAGRVKRGRYVRSAIGISRDEIHRAKDSRVGYVRHEHPLLWLPGAADGREGWQRSDCVRYLRATGFGSTPKSACVGCPLRRNAGWRRMRENDPASWADAVEFDHAIRRAHPQRTAHGNELRAGFHLHWSGQPLQSAPIDHVTRREWAARQTDLIDAIADAEHGLGDPDDDPDADMGCSPFGCPDEQTGTAT